MTRGVAYVDRCLDIPGPECPRESLLVSESGAFIERLTQRRAGGVASHSGRRFFRNTDRIISIKFYVSHLETRDGIVHHRHAYREMTNEASRFYGGQNWDLFTGYVVPVSWNGMPPKWQRLFFFPASPP